MLKSPMSALNAFFVLEKASGITKTKKMRSKLFDEFDRLADVFTCVSKKA